MIDLKNSEYKNQRENGIQSNEGYVYVHPENSEKIIKVIDTQASELQYLKIKQHTIELLLKNQDILQTLKIAIPEEGVQIDGELRGYKAPNIKGRMLSCALSHIDIPLEVKIGYLKQVGLILRGMEEIREKHPNLSNFFYNDIHEQNFIVNYQGIVYGIDIDSCSIEDNIPSAALYPALLAYTGKSKIPKKYQQCNPPCPSAATMVPDQNLDIYCYIYMIVNFMYGKPIYNLDKKTLFDYLNYLDSNGANDKLLYYLARVFDDEAPNYNPVFLLDYIKEIYQYSNYRYDKSGKLSRILR